MTEIVIQNGRRMLKTTVKCDCECHQEGTAIMHFMACCNNGYKHFYDEVDDNDNVLPKEHLKDFKIIIPKEYGKLNLIDYLKIKE